MRSAVWEQEAARFSNLQTASIQSFYPNELVNYKSYTEMAGQRPSNWLVGGVSGVVQVDPLPEQTSPVIVRLQSFPLGLL